MSVFFCVSASKGCAGFLTRIQIRGTCKANWISKSFPLRGKTSKSRGLCCACGSQPFISWEAPFSEFGLLHFLGENAIVSFFFLWENIFGVSQQKRSFQGRSKRKELSVTPFRRTTHLPRAKEISQGHNIQDFFISLDFESRFKVYFSYFQPAFTYIPGVTPSTIIRIYLSLAR